MSLFQKGKAPQHLFSSKTIKFVLADMKNLMVSLFLYGLALVLYNQLLNENYESGGSGYSTTMWNYKEKLAAYVDRERPHRETASSDDNTRDLHR